MKKIKKMIRVLRIRFYRMMIAVGTADMERARGKLTDYEDKLTALYRGAGRRKKAETARSRKKIETHLRRIRKREFTPYDNYITYLYRRIRVNSVLDVSGKVMSASKQYFVIARTLRFFAVFIAFIETSAILILLFTLTIGILPLLLFCVLVSFLSDRVRAYRYNDRIEKEIEGKRVLIFVAGKDALHRGTAFSENIRELSEQKDSVIFIVTNAVKGFDFAAVRKYSGSVWLLKTSYYFVLQKKFFEGRPRVAVIW